MGRVMKMNINKLLETNYDIEVKGICCNSAQAQPGDVFVAVTGFKTDGHKYIPDAVKKGAVCVVAEHEADAGVPVIVVENSRAALAKMAHEFYGQPTHNFKLVGVTGTNGKTTVTYLVKDILEAAGEKVGLIGTNQNMIGSECFETERTTPDILDLVRLFDKMAHAGCTYVVMEVSSHSLELNRVNGCEFEVSAFTNLTQDHLDFHITMENYLAAKAKLFKICNKAVINIDDNGGKRIARDVACSKITYGTVDADITATDITLHPASVEFNCMGDRFTLHIPGMFSVYNALAAISICKALGIDKETIKNALASAHGVKGRFEIYPAHKDYTVIIDYAHSPDGLKKILETIKGFAKGRIVVLFGCGGDRDAKKRPLMGKIAGELADFCIITSDNPRSEEPAAIIRDILSGMENATADYVVIENRRDAIGYAIKNAQKDDVIVLAGKGHETYQILNTGTIHFDEREVLAEFIK